MTRTSIDDAPPGVWYRIADDVSRTLNEMEPEELAKLRSHEREAWSAHEAEMFCAMFNATVRAMRKSGQEIGENSVFEKGYFNDLPWAGILVRTARVYGIDI